MLEHAAWGESLQGLRVIDLYAGSGALGFEAVSRGAGFCLFVETDDGARGAIRENMDAYGLFGRCRVHRRSATDLGPRPGSAGEAFTLLVDRGFIADGVATRPRVLPSTLPGVIVGELRTPPNPSPMAPPPAA